MRIPFLSSEKKTKAFINSFGGIDTTPGAKENEFSKMMNLCSDDFPNLSVRANRVNLAEITDFQGMSEGELYAYAAGGSLYFNNVCQVDTLVSVGKKSFVKFGSYLLVFPDKYYINTEKTDENGISLDKGYIDSTFSRSSNSFKIFDSCLMGGISPTVQSETPQIQSEHGDIYWVNTSDNYKIKYLPKGESSWVDVICDYTCIYAENIGSNFNADDGITFYHDGKEISTFIVEKMQNCIIVPKISDTFSSSANIEYTVSRKMPELDFICEYKNRLWGCFYGKSENGETVNEIYCSKLGDFKNWNCNKGISTDSYVCSMGSPGKFTGIYSHLGYVLFFKENAIHKLYGDRPSNFSVGEEKVFGIAENCDKSTSVCGDTLYYLSKNGVYAFDGSTPYSVSDKLGKIDFSSACAASMGDKYYLCVKSDNSKNRLLVLDTQKGMWHEEDNPGISALYPFGDNIVACCETTNSKTKLSALNENGLSSKFTDFFPNKTTDSKPKWYAETTYLGLNSTERKLINKITLRLSVEKGCSMNISAKYDSGENWEKIFTETGKDNSVVTIPFLSKPCSAFRLRFEGSGKVNLYSITREYKYGGEF